MRTLLLIATLIAAGAAPALSNESRLHSAPNSEERFSLCAVKYDARGKEFAECWAGQRPTQDEACAAGGAYLNHPWASDWQKLAVYEKMRNNGCLD